MKSKFIEALGLITNPSKVKTLGGCSFAHNVVARRPGKLDRVRGRSYFATASPGVRKLFDYEGYLLAAFVDDTLKRTLTGPTFTAYTGSYTNVDGLDAKIRAFVAQSNLLLLTGGGIFRLSGATGTPVRAGAPRGLCFDRLGPAAVLVTAGGWLTDQYQAAYKACVCIKDAKGVTHIGEPSGRTVVANASFTSGWVTTEAKNVVLRLLLSDDATTDHFFQIYRSKKVPVGTQPDEDLQLVYQDYLTTKNITDGYVDVTDTYSDLIPKGAFIHTSPNFANAAGMIDGENGLPPAAVTGGVFRDRAFLFGLLGYQTYQLTMLATPVGVDQLTFTSDSGATFSVSAVVGAGSITTYHIETGGSTTQNIEQTALNLVELINRMAANTFLDASYVSGPDDMPGKILLRTKTPNASRFSVLYVAGSGGGAAQRLKYDPVLVPAAQNYTLQRVGTTVTATAATANMIRAGERISHPGATGFPTGTYLVLTSTATTFTFTEGSGAAGPSAAVAVTLVGAPDAIKYSAADDEPNAFAYSKIREMEAFPLRNRGTVGEKGVEVGAVSFLRDSVVVWTYQGVYRLTGDSPDTFAATLLDPTAKLVSPNSVVQMGQSAIGWTTNGVIQIDESGWRVLSDDITPTLEALTNSRLPELRQKAFAIAVESDKVYELWYPTSAGSVIYEAYFCSLATGRWSSRALFEASSGGSADCGLYRSDEDRIYWAGITPNAGFGTAGVVYKERKALSSADHQEDISRVTGAGMVATTYPISSTIVHNPFGGTSLGNTKNWQQLELLFEDLPPATVVVGMANENATEGQTIVPADQAPIVRSWPSSAMAGTTRLAVTVTTTALVAESFSYLGCVFYWEEFEAQAVR